MNAKRLTILTVAVGLALLAFKLFASNFPLNEAFNTQTTTALTASGTTTTNSVGTGFWTEANLYHTFEAICTGSAAQQIAIDRSLDGSNWIVVSTNAVAATTGITEVTMTGKWSYMRVRQIGTNSALSVLYLGGR